MNDLREEGEPLDPVLLGIFSEQHRDPAPEPFLATNLRLVQRERRRMRLVKRCLQAVAVSIVVVASPWLIEASTRMSYLLNSSFAVVSDWLGTPLGALAALIVGAIFALRYRRRRWR